MKIGFLVGTRPELIKMAPVIHEAARRNVPHVLVHTGQHYSQGLDAVFFRDLELPPPTVNLQVGSLPPGRQLGEILARAADALQALRPTVVMVQGDTMSVLGGALAAHLSGVPVAHLEAGLRSDDWDMPEEANRVLTGNLASLHFCPTTLQAERLRQEGITHGVHVVGNTVVDACLRWGRATTETPVVLSRLGLTARGYALLTLHRPSNVDDPGRLRAWIQVIGAVARAGAFRVVFPVHPRARAVLQHHGLHDGISAPPWLTLEPLGYRDLLQLAACADVILTDSGGLQEEACALRVPCITLRRSTERPETLEVGANVLCPEPEAGALGAAVTRMRARERSWINPLGDGTTAARVLDVLLQPGMVLRPSRAPR
ncbi:MAG: UDP-N-acetylglucosamine 2-epimerase (non-hydrolyzing) [Myxococcota bacterium]